MIYLTLINSWFLQTIKSNQLSEKTVLDGATPPVNTIIFENTNFKSAPGTRPSRADKSCTNKLEDGGIEQAVISSFNKPMRDLLNKNDKQSDAIQMQLSFNKEDSADIKLDFFESELSHLTDDKSSKSIALPRSMHGITSTNSNTISATTADALNFKIASVKKVWESMPTVIEHSVGQDDSNASFAASFGPDPNSLDPSGAFSKSGDTPDDTHEVYSTSPNQPTSNNTTNVCKVWSNLNSILHNKATVVFSCFRLNQLNRWREQLVKRFMLLHISNTLL